jgi:hypothetical protein
MSKKTSKIIIIIKIGTELSDAGQYLVIKTSITGSVPLTTMKTLTVLAILLLGYVHDGEAFTTRSHPCLQRQAGASFLPTRLKFGSPVLRLYDDDGSFEDSFSESSDDDSDNTKRDPELSSVPLGSSPWVLPNGFDLFLTQCSIQSFLFLCKSLRDPQTVLWVEDFTQSSIRQKKRHGYAAPSGGTGNSKLLNYHGLAALNTTLFPTWDSYFSKLLEQPMEIFIIESHSAYVPEYELEIKPASLCARIVSVREQIAREWIRDLDVIAAMGGHTLASYWESLRERREESTDDVAGGNTPVKLPRENLFFLELNVNDDSDYAPSPLRKGNFDLLVLLSTQESIHRVLNDPDRQSGIDRVTNYYLRSFYAQRLVSHFSGAQRYGRADDFLEELLGTAPSVVTLSDGATTLIDTHSIAEMVLKEREAVALEWKELSRNVPQEHMEIKRLQLNLLMGIANEPVARQEVTGEFE